MEAGKHSPHLDDEEQRQAAEGAPIGPLVIHEIVREQGEIEIERPFSGLAWSGLAAGLSIGFSFVTEATLQSALPDTPWQRLVSSLGYCIGFLIVILGRQQLFTETTLTALIPALTLPSPRTILGAIRVWSVVLGANLIGTFAFGALAAQPGIFPAETRQAMAALSAQTMAHPFGHVVITAGSAGWLIGLMVWLLPGAGPARPLIIILLTYVVAVCQFPHIIAGSVEAIYGVFTGAASVSDYFRHFLLPTLAGNAVGGTILAALLNHAPIATELPSRREHRQLEGLTGMRVGLAGGHTRKRKAPSSGPSAPIGKGHALLI